MSLPFVTGFTSFSTIHIGTLDGYFGFRFVNTCGSPIVITELGRWASTGNTGVHTVGLFNSSAVALASGEVNCSGLPTGFRYTELAEPYIMNPADVVFCLSKEVSGSDVFYSNGGTNVLTSDVGGTITSAKITGGITHDNMDNGRMYGPVDFKYSSPLPNWTKTGINYYTDGSQYSVNSAITDSSAGDIINIPSGHFTYGAAATYLNLSRGQKLLGAGTGQTNIYIATGAGSYTSATIRLTSAALVSGFRIVQPNNGTPSAFSTSSQDGWRITNILYDSAASAGYFVYASNYGLIDNCVINGGGGSDEWIFTRGPTDSWQTPSSYGTANAVYVEDCTFNRYGYTDFNANARAVVRFCTLTAQLKLDAHGLASNTPARGVRHVEMYNNTWTSTGSFALAFEIRGGSAKIFNNQALIAPDNGYGMRLTDYGATATWPNFGNQYQTLYNYPIADQIGVGMDPKVAASEPAYIWNNTKRGNLWGPDFASIPGAAIAVYTGQVGNTGATYTMQDIIAENRDYFRDYSGVFNGASGIGVGLKTQMTSITPTKTGVGFWVTDEGSWNSYLPTNTAGQLYVWDGNSWTLDYTPYTYPHPLRAGERIKSFHRLGRHLKLRGLAYF